MKLFADIFTVGHFVLQLCLCAWEQQLRELSGVQIYQQRVVDTLFFGNAQNLNDSRALTTDALSDLCFVQSQVAQPQDFAAISHAITAFVVFTQDV